MSRNIAVGLSLCSLLCLLYTPLQAQLNWSPVTEESNITFQWLKPSFDTEADMSFLSGNYYLGGRWFVKPGFFVLAEIPFASYSFETDTYLGGTYERSGSAFGNPYIGVEAGPADRFFVAEVGLRVPVADADYIDDNWRSIALAYATYADFERLSAFIDNNIPVRATMNIQPWLSEGTTRLRIKLGIWQYIPHDEGDKGVSVLHWGFWLMHQEDNLHLGGGYVADFIVDEDVDAEDAQFHQIAFNVGMTFNRVTPNITIRLPLNENLSDALDFAFMLGASFHLK